jgi:hypothetical protein
MSLSAAIAVYATLQLVPTTNRRTDFVARLVYTTLPTTGCAIQAACFVSAAPHGLTIDHIGIRDPTHIFLIGPF